MSTALTPSTANATAATSCIDPARINLCRTRHLQVPPLAAESGALLVQLRNCASGVRAWPYACGSGAYAALDLYLEQRAAGVAVETPAVRP